MSLQLFSFLLGMGTMLVIMSVLAYLFKDHIMPVLMENGFNAMAEDIDEDELGLDEVEVDME